METRPRLPAPPPLATLLAAGPLALFLDFDGTLVEIASGPDAIQVPGGLAKGLENLAARLGGALAVVTGRSIDNLKQFLGPVDLHLAGSHGGHVVAPSGDALREAEALPGRVRHELDGFARERGILYERKSHGAALHYRTKPELEDDARTFASNLAREHGLETKTGKCVIEIVRPGIDKGGAVELLAALAPFGQAAPVFVGDDFTDEDGFAACNRLGGFGILVGDPRETSARYGLENVRDVHAWLNL